MPSKRWSSENLYTYTGTVHYGVHSYCDVKTRTTSSPRTIVVDSLTASSDVTGPVAVGARTLNDVSLVTSERTTALPLAAGSTGSLGGEREEQNSQDVITEPSKLTCPRFRHRCVVSGPLWL